MEPFSEIRYGYTRSKVQRWYGRILFLKDILEPMERIIKKAKKYCMGLLHESRCKSLPFHNERHTMEVFKNTLKIGMYENLDMKVLEPVLLAAMFHDTGNTKVFNGHEDLSARAAMSFLENEEYPSGTIAVVLDCILATRMPQNPESKLQRIICDADLFHLGTDSYDAKNKLLRSEWEKFLNLKYSDEAWITLNIEFLMKHTFHTSYGTDVLEPVKQENIRGLRRNLQKLPNV